MCNSSYSLILIFLKLYIHHDHALKICMWFGYNPQINFCHFCNLTMKVNGQCVQILLQFNTDTSETLQTL